MSDILKQYPTPWRVVEVPNHPMVCLTFDARGLPIPGLMGNRHYCEGILDLIVAAVNEKAARNKHWDAVDACAAQGGKEDVGGL
jgi:hypothetical protein